MVSTVSRGVAKNPPDRASRLLRPLLKPCVRVSRTRLFERICGSTRGLTLEPVVNFSASRFQTKAIFRAFRAFRGFIHAGTTEVTEEMEIRNICRGLGDAEVNACALAEKRKTHESYPQILSKSRF